MKERKEIELHCFLALKQLLIMYWNKQISADSASKIKQQIFADYEKRCKEFDFWTSIYKEQVEASNRTAYFRTELKKKWKSNEMTESSIAEMLDMALEIISITYKEEF